MLLLDVATNLPELAITVTAAHARRRDLIAGSIVAQTTVLAVIDGVVYRRGEPHTFPD